MAAILGPRFNLPFVTVIDAAGVPIPAALLNFYLTGSNTRAPTYSDSALSVPNTNPVAADAGGQFPNIFLDPSIIYKVVLTDAATPPNEIWTADPVSGEFGTAANFAALRGFGTGFPIVYVLGAVSQADGGQGWFYYDPTDTTSADNGGTIIVSGSARWKRLYNGAVFPEWFGAAGNGTTADDAAFTKVLALGDPVQGTPGSIYALANPLTITSVPNFEMFNATFKDLTPASTTRKFIYGTGNESVRLSNVTVLRNGDGAGGSFNSAAAIWIDTATYIDLVGIEVTGMNAGAGMHIVDCAGGVIDRAYIHDMTAGTSSSANPGDGADQIAGIWIEGCTGVTVSSPNVINLLTQCVDYGPENINTRGLTFSGPGTGVAVTNGFVSNVDEGYDLSGDQVFTGWQFTACRAELCRKFGFKAANTANIGRFVNCYAYRCTLDGFYLQGSNVAVSPTTNNLHDVQCISCVAQETGFNVGTYYPGFTTSGFRCDNSGADATYPRNCRFVDCRAFGGADMKTGFNNSVGAAYLGQDRNRVINCSASDFTQDASEGFVDGTSILALTGDQSIATGTDTGIIWNHATNGIDGLGLITGGATAALTFPYAGRFAVSTVGPFNQNTTGNRAIFAQVNSSQIPGQRDIRKSNAVSETTPQINFIWDFAAADVLTILVNQDSGGALGLNGGDTSLRITDLNSPPQIVLTF